MKPRILVLGAGGYVGSTLVAAIHATQPGDVVASYRQLPKVAPTPGIQLIQLDSKDAAAVATALVGIDIIVNCIAGNPAEMLESGTTLFAVASQINPRPGIVHLSSMAVYGSQTGTVSENDPLLGDVGPYAAAKLELEKIAAAYSRAVVLRPGCIYGADSPQWTLRIGRWLRSRRIGDCGALGDGFSNLVHVDDVVAAILAGIRTEAAWGQSFNLAATPNLRWNDYFFQLAKLLGAVPIKRITRRRLLLETRAVAPPLKVMQLISERFHVGMEVIPEPIPPSLLRLWQQEILLDSSKAERELGLVWTPLEAGLQPSHRWRRE